MYNGEPEGTQYNFGSSGLYSAFDAADNIYIYYSTGNGAGAELMCLKVNTEGDTLWGPVNVIEGTQGLFYQFSGISDGDGITFVWQGYGDGGNWSKPLCQETYFRWRIGLGWANSTCLYQRWKSGELFLEKIGQ